MRFLPWLLIILLVVVQYRLWVGDGSLAEVWGLHKQVKIQQQENLGLRERNQALEAEVQDLKQGLDAIEERAREELGMVKNGETFYQIVEDSSATERAQQ